MDPMTNRRFHLAILVMTAFCTAGILAIPARAATPVTDITIAPSGEFVELSVVGGGTLLCDQFSEAAKNDRPFRIVLDFCDAEHAIGKLNFESLPACRIARIRTSQFASKPRSIVRVVLDMKEDATFSVVPNGPNLTVRIADPKHASFAVWHANPGAAPVLAQKPVDKPAGVSAQDKDASQLAMQESKPAAKPVTPATTPVVKQEPKPVVVAEKPAAKPSDKPVTVAEKPTAKPSDKPATVVAKTESKTPVVPAEKPATTVAQKPTETKPAATPVAKPSSHPETEQTPAVATTNVPPPAKTLTLPPTPLVFNPDFVEAQPADKPVSTDSKSKTPVSVESMQPIGPAVATSGADGKTMAKTDMPPSPMLATTTTAPSGGVASSQPGTPVGEVAATDPVSPADEALDQNEGTLLERLKSKFFGDQSMPRPYTTVPVGPSGGQDVYGPPSPNANISREALLERIRQAQERMAAGLNDSVIAGVGSAPTRELLFYDDMARRDPFAPLVSGQRSGFVSDELPNLENLRLVGVLRDDSESLALLENLEGFSYVLRVGDKVQNGSLVTIQPNRALFRVDDYGWSHVVALQLTARGTDPTKSLGAVQQVFPSYESDQEKKTETPTEPKGSEGE